MTREEMAAMLDAKAALEKANEQLTERNDELQHQLDWFKRQLFGEKSERRLTLDESRQLSLGESLEVAEPLPAEETEVKGHARRKRLSGPGDSTKLRFDPSLPVREEDVPCPEAKALDPGSYDIVGHKTTSRLLQKPGTFEIVRYRRPVIKRRDNGAFLTPDFPLTVLERCVADVSVLACTLVDKFVYHLPLYRQHQRMEQAGVYLSRSTLTNWAQRTSELLVPIYQAQLSSILDSAVLAMDETPIKAGRKAKGKMKTGYFWPIFGEKQEIAFVFAPTRATRVIHEALGPFQGVLLTDGYEAYERFAKATDGVIRAQCWSHARRKFVEAEASESVLTKKALDWIAELYEHESILQKKHQSGEKALLYRAVHCKPIVDRFFAWLADAFHDHLLLPSSPFTKAANYALEREKALKVFLENPDVPLDTNHLEREIRPIALGRKNWLFCWTEMGAQQVAVVQSLLRTCRMHGIDPYTYLVDVLQRIATHPAKNVHQLTPRLWKEHFADDPMRSIADER